MFKLTDFNERTQAQIRRQIANDSRPVLSTVPQCSGRKFHQRQDTPQAIRPRRLVISILGLRTRTLDDDNFNGGCKSLRDAIANSLGLDDGDKRITWQYSHTRTEGRQAVIVHIELI